jgi:putative oxidoreductase
MINCGLCAGPEEGDLLEVPHAEGFHILDQGCARSPGYRQLLPVGRFSAKERPIMSMWSSPANHHFDRPTSTAPGAQWLDRLLATKDDLAPTIARLALGIVMLPHGLQKMFGLFGGFGYAGTMGFFTQSGIPVAFAFLAIMAEFLGSIGLIVGGVARVAAFGIAVNMLVAIATVHLPNGFFMNWYGNQKGEGFEYHLLAIGLALLVMVKGAGRASLDRWLSARLEHHA